VPPNQPLYTEAGELHGAARAPLSAR
jgi:hypothetical protein